MKGGDKMRYLLIAVFVLVCGSSYAEENEVWWPSTSDVMEQRQQEQEIEDMQRQIDDQKRQTESNNLQLQIQHSENTGRALYLED
jgi:hypothetical protein